MLCSSSFFFLLYIGIVFVSLWISFGIFQFFLEKRFETALLSIRAEIRIVSLCWNIFQCFFLPFPLFILFGWFFFQKKGIPRWYGWIFFILGSAWILPPDPFFQLFFTIFSIGFYEWFFWVFLFLNLPKPSTI